MTAKVIMVASGKGGTGKSTLSVLTGAALADYGKKVLLVELDAGLRSVDIISGVFGKTVYDIEDILSGRCEPDKAVVESQEYPGLFVISAPYSGGEILPSSLKVMVKKMSAFFDYIIIDTAAGLGAPLKAAMEVASMGIIVITPDPVTVRDGRIVSDEMTNSKIREIRLVVNKVIPEKRLKSGIENLDECIDTVGAQLIGVVPRTEEILIASARGHALNKDGLSWRVFKALAGRICGENIPLLIK